MMVRGVQLSLAVVLWHSTAVQAVLRKSSECSESLGCISNPEATIMLTWQPTSQHVHFTLRGYIGSGDVYVAMGLSHDSLMGDDDVTECVHTGGNVGIHSSYNAGKSNARYTDGALSNRSGVYESGTMQCSFSRPVEGGGGGGGDEGVEEGGGGGGGGRGQLGSGPMRHDLRQQWYIMLVWGKLMPGSDSKQQHSYRSVSSHKVSLQAVGSFETLKLSDTLIHIHGTLMMIAWVTLTSIGVIIARHYKGLLPGTRLQGKDVWFQVHRVLMVMVVLSTVVGVVVIFVEVGGYRETTSSTDIFALLHPILGLVVTALAIFNPIIALFRPTPTAPRRPIFNWVHRCIGTGAQVIAVVTIIFGMMLKKVSAPLSMLFALGGFVVWHFTMEAIFFCIICSRKKNLKRRKSSKSYAVQGKQDVTDNRPRSSKVSVFQEILLMMHSAVAIATTIFLITTFLSKREH